MNAVIFKQTLHDSRRAVLAIGIIGALLAIMIVALFPSFSEFEEINAMLDSPIFSALFGEIGDYTTPEGFIGNEFFSFLPLMMAFYSVFVGLQIFSADESRGALDILLSAPIPRWRVVVERLLAYVVSYLGMMLITYAGFVLILMLVPEVQLGLDKVAAAVLNIFPLLLLQTTLTLFVSTLVRGGNKAAGISGGIIIASYFVTALADLAGDALRVVKPLSMFSYYSGYHALKEGFQWGNMGVLITVALGLAVLSVIAFERRDVTV